MTTSNTLVTVIVAVFDDGRFLRQALASVTAQTHPALELIVTDDGSTDPATRSLLDALAADGVRVLRNPHGGLSANRNHALAAATGEYCVCLDADDELDTGYLARAAAVLDAEPGVGIVTPDMLWFGAAAHLERTTFDLGRQLIGNRLPAVSMTRIAAVRAVGGFCETLPHHEDWDLWLSLLERGWTVHLLGTPDLRRRAHPGQMSTGLNARSNPPVFAEVMRRHQGLYAEHAEEFWAALLAEREVLAHFKRRYGRAEDRLHWLAARLPRPRRRHR